MRSLLSARHMLALAALTVVSGFLCGTANADHGNILPFGGYGFYQPYGARYSSSLETPPYFALNPPVYYGARYARPYGISPFAAPPSVRSPLTYRGRLYSEAIVAPRVKTNPMAPCCAKTEIKSKDTQELVTTVNGPVRGNPFVVADRLVSKQ